MVITLTFIFHVLYCMLCISTHIQRWAWLYIWHMCIASYLQCTLMKAPSSGPHIPFFFFICIITLPMIKPKMAIAPKTAPTMVIIRMMDRGGSGDERGREGNGGSWFLPLAPAFFRVYRRFQFSLTPALHPHPPYPISG